VVVYLRIVEPERHSGPRGGGANKEKIKIVWTNPLKIIMVNSFINGVGIGFIMPIVVLFFTDKFGMDAMGIGTIMSVSGFIGLFASYLAGRMSDKLGRKPLIGLGNYTARLADAFLPFTSNITQTGIVVSIRSLGFNTSMPAFRALRADLVPPEVRGRLFGLFGTGFTAGSVLGPIIGTWVYDTYREATFNVLGLQVPGYGIPFLVNAVLGLLTTTMIMLFIKEPEEHEKAPQFAAED
jgi:MFS family permease